MFGRTIILLALFAQNLLDPYYTQLYEKGIKENQKKPMETITNTENVTECIRHVFFRKAQHTLKIKVNE